MDLISFTESIMTSVAGGAAYDGVKLVLNDQFDKLQGFLENNEKDKFELVLQTLIDSNETIRQQLEQLQRGENLTLVQQNHTGFGDNVAGDKIVHQSNK